MATDEKTQVQHIRIDKADIEKVRRVARQEVRSLQDQYRKIVRDWVKSLDSE